ncbi:hypothetical protein [Motiliproteus sediminis]|uniref:hypothetical protein n=1 Tax=Motiliproteus sediminis TaxID=1468178 RepID=UPI001AF000AB|nr:hypothetical protein [Motiliproteus sediminis]
MEILTALAVAAALVWLWRRQPSAKQRSAPAKKAPKSRWHAVEVLASANACSAAHNARGHRFLSRESPTLPLENCDCSQCNCRFKHHEDRRSGDRRTHLDRTYHQITASVGQERRQRHDRRRALI